MKNEIVDLHPEISRQPGQLALNCAYLSADVYNDVHDPRYGYVRIYELGPTASGYFGACYVPTLNYPSYAIIAHRGTSNVQDLIADIALAEGKAFKQLTEAKNFGHDSVRALADKYGHDINAFPIYHTGHSLGAVLSDAAATECTYSHESVTFENPGSKKIVAGCVHRSTTSYSIFQSPIDFINTCNAQVAPINRFIHKPIDYSGIPMGMLQAPFDIPVNPFMNGFYLSGNTFDQHSILKIIEHMKAHGTAVRDTSPVGFKAGYAAYLDTHKNQLYWHNYFKYAFDQGKYGTPIPWETFLNSGLAAVEKARGQIHAELEAEFQAEVVEEEKPYTPLASPRSMGLFSIEKTKNDFVVVEDKPKSSCLIS